MVSKPCVTSSTLFSTFTTVLSFPVISSFTISGSISKRLIMVLEVGLITTLTPPNDSATEPYSPYASKAKLSIPIRIDERAESVFMVTDLPAPDLPKIIIL